VLLTLERCHPGWLVGLFYGRQDLGSAAYTAIGSYSEDKGTVRAVLMPSLTTTDYGISDEISYENVQRFAVPSERATGQTLSMEFWSGMAWQPFAIKAVTVETRSTDNSKVTQ
jgi:hypothetical protein